MDSSLRLSSVAASPWGQRPVHPLELPGCIFCAPVHTSPRVIVKRSMQYPEAFDYRGHYRRPCELPRRRPEA